MKTATHERSKQLDDKSVHQKIERIKTQLFMVCNEYSGMYEIVSWSMWLEVIGISIKPNKNIGFDCFS